MESRRSHASRNAPLTAIVVMDRWRWSVLGRHGAGVIQIAFICLAMSLMSMAQELQDTASERFRSALTWKLASKPSQSPPWPNSPPSGAMNSPAP